MSEANRGFLYGCGAYFIWGFAPLYFKLLRPSTPIEILAHRIVWSAAFVALLLLVLRRWAWLRGLARRRTTLGLVALAGALIAGNWGTYVYAVNSNHVVEAALGYFVSPLVQVVLGVLVLRERMRRWQWIAVGVCAVAVVTLTVNYGRPPWISLALAGTFGCYALTKNRIGLPAAEGMFAESVALAVPAAVYLGWLIAAGNGTFGHVSGTHTTLVALSGALTALPLLLFAGAANRIPLSALGMLQYLTPIMQLGFGVLLFREPMPPARLAGFALVWVALAVFTWDSIRQRRGERRLAAGGDAAPAGTT